MIYTAELSTAPQTPAGLRLWAEQKGWLLWVSSSQKEKEEAPGLCMLLLPNLPTGLRVPTEESGAGKEWPGVTHEWIFILIKGTITRAKKLSPPEISCKIYSTCACSVGQSCLTLGNHMVCSLPGSSVHRVFQATIQEWVAVPSSKGSSRRGDWTTSLASPALAGRFITAESSGKHLALSSLCNL